MPYRYFHLAAVVVLLVGCKWIGLKAGLGYTVTEPEEESPEWVVQQVLKAAAIEPFSDAWAEYSKYLHSDETGSPISLGQWETLRFTALRRKHKCYLEDSAFSYTVMEELQLEEDYMQIRVKCKTSDVPTPCHLFKDKGNGGKWRVKMNCLN